MVSRLRQIVDNSERNQCPAIPCTGKVSYQTRMDHNSSYSHSGEFKSSRSAEVYPLTSPRDMKHCVVHPLSLLLITHGDCASKCIATI
jgi:hypothetical protein